MKIFFVSVITCLIFCILLLSLVVYLPSPSLLTYAGYADAVTVANVNGIDDPFTSHLVGELVKSGTLISLKDLWSFQTSFYQTIIIFLIAINGLIVGISVVYIKNTSDEKVDHITKNHIDSKAFHLLVEEKVSKASKNTFKQAQKDFDTSAKEIDESLDRLNILENDNSTLRQQVKIISNRVAELDTSENEGKDNQLIIRGDLDGVCQEIYNKASINR
ncbi:hypothetical protein [uncultured Shewanella sp.]|uniref:hypothetical protein n=1 Tax=uncultured Shewanella sp. TaxID=173975 RepID=UPI00262E830C|nr:hypothetical protein [uncultured Shewanella sp.]